MTQPELIMLVGIPACGKSTLTKKYKDLIAVEKLNLENLQMVASIKNLKAEAIKEFGFYGYRYSTESEPIKIHQLLFLKAYALGNFEARDLMVVDEELDCCKSNFEKEMELLLFDM